MALLLFIQKFVHEIYLSLARDLGRCANNCPVRGLNGRFLDFEQTHFDCPLCRLVVGFANRAKILIITQPLEKADFSDVDPVLANNLGKFANQD